jgi:hypothetical protein
MIVGGLIFISGWLMFFVSEFNISLAVFITGICVLFFGICVETKMDRNRMKYINTEKEESTTKSKSESPSARENECVICMKNARSVASRRCGHRCMCSECENQLYPKQCPICRKKYKTAITIYG